MVFLNNQTCQARDIALRIPLATITMATTNDTRIFMLNNARTINFYRRTADNAPSQWNIMFDTPSRTLRSNFGQLLTMFLKPLLLSVSCKALLLDAKAKTIIFTLGPRLKLVPHTPNYNRSFINNNVCTRFTSRI